VAFACRHALAHRYAGLVDRLRAARDQMMPPVKVLAFRDEPVGAGRWKPGERAYVLGRQTHAIIDLFQPVLVIRAAAEPGVEQPAADGRPVDVACILVLELGHAAFAAAVTKRFPLGRGHLLERLRLPEGFHRDDLVPPTLMVKAPLSLG